MTKSFFPDYYGVFVVRDDILEQYPELEGILEELTGKISTEQMAEMTYQVDVLGRTVDDVAQGVPGESGIAERVKT